MWHEARKQEKKLRGIIVDYRKRAERRREFYEKFKADPTQFIQVHGRRCKILLEPQVAAAAEKSMMPWQGNSDNLIDRFDVRAHLDYIPESNTSPQPDARLDLLREDEENPGVNYERYRILIQNELSNVPEDKFLNQIHIEEQFGTTTLQYPGKDLKIAGKAIPKATIGYTYEDSAPAGSTMSAVLSKPGLDADVPQEESDEEIDFDLLVNMDELTQVQKGELNNHGTKYGLGIGDFMKYLNNDAEEREQLRLTKIQEEEKQAMSGRKARRERRAYKDRLILNKGYISPPSYAARMSTSPSNVNSRPRSTSKSDDSRSGSRSVSPEKITYITSFGGNDSEDEKKRMANQLRNTGSVFGPTLPSLPIRKRDSTANNTSVIQKNRVDIKKSPSPKYNRKRNKRTTSSSRSRSRSRSRKRQIRRRRSSSRSSSRSRRRRGRSKSRSASRSRSHSRRSRDRDRRRNSRSRRRSSSYKRRSRSSSYSRYKKTSKRHSRSSSSSSSPKRNPKEKSTNLPSSSTAQSTNSNNGVSTSTLGSGTIHKAPSPPVKRYYGRKKSQGSDDKSDHSSSSSESSDDSEKRRGSDASTSRAQASKGNSSVCTSSKFSYSGQAKTAQERLKKRMAAALNRQLKADKDAQKTRDEKQLAEKLEREESLRELTIKYRRREREKRHRERRSSSSSHSSSKSSKSRSRSRSP